jgi:autotransporter-associated beta strand protein
MSLLTLATLLGFGVVQAQTPLYWGGGSIDIPNATALPVTSNGLSGVWNATTENWAADYNGNTYQAFADGSFANLGYFNQNTAGVIARSFIGLEANVTLSGMMMSLLSPVGDNHRFVMTSSVARTITMTGTNFLLAVLAQNVNRGFELRNVALSGTMPFQKIGDSIWLVYANQPDFRSTVHLQGGRTTLRDGGAWPVVSNLMIRGFATRSTDDLGGNNFSLPDINILAHTTGAINQVHNDAVITLSRGALYYQGRGNNTLGRESSQTVKKIVLDPQGFLDIQTATSGGTYTGKLILTQGIDRGPSGRGTLLIVGTNMLTDVIVSQGVTPGGIVPWIANTRGEFIQLNPSTLALQRVPATDAPTDLSLWAPGNNYRVGNNSAFIPSGVIGNTSINALGLYANDNVVLTIGNGNTLTISSGGINHQPAGSGKQTVFKGGQLTTGTDELVIHGGDSANAHSVSLDTAIVDPPGGTLNLLKSGAGLLTLAGTQNNTYSGTTYVNMGVIETRKTNAIAIPGNLVIQRGGTVILRGVGTAISSTSEIIIEEDGIFSVIDNTPAHAAPITINGGTYRIANRFPSLTLAGTGLAFNGGRIDHRSTAIGTFSLQTDVSYASSSTRQALWNRHNTGLFTVELDGGNRTFNIADSLTLPVGVPEMLFLVAITNGSPAGGSITKTGAGTLQFAMTNYYTGGTVINQGTLHVANYQAPGYTGLRASPQSSLSHGSVISFHAPIATNLLIGQTISGTGISAGRTVLEIMNPYMIQANGGNVATNVTDVAIGAIQQFGSLGTGPVTNNGGILRVDAGVVLNNAITINSGTVTNNGTFSGTVTLNGGVLTGTGTNSGSTILIGGVVQSQIKNGATINGSISPAGTATGTLQVTGNVTWNSGSSWNAANDWYFDLGPNSTSDLLQITGNFIKGANSAFRFDFRGFGGAGTFVLVEWTGTLQDFTADDFSFVNLAAGHSASFSIVGNQLRVTVSPCQVSPTVTLGNGPSQCSPSSPANVTVSHTSSGSPTKYSIDFSDAANTAGFVDILNQAYNSSPLPFTIPADVVAGIYTARVTMADSSGCSGYDEFTVTITAAPVIPGVISQGGGGSTVCAGSSGVTYSVSSVAGATTYTWSVPESATITAGQGTSQITVNWSAGTGAGDLQIGVIAGNTCGTSPQRNTTFTIRTGTPDAPISEDPTDISISSFTANWTAPAFVNGHQVEGYQLDVSTASDFTTGFVVSNQSLASSQVSYVLTGLNGGQTYYYRVRAYNSCGSSMNSSTKTVLTPLILAGWDVSPLPGGSGNYGSDGLAATYHHDGLSVVGLTRGAGVGTAGIGTPRGWGGTTWNSTTAGNAINANQFVTFTMTPTEGNFVSFYSISKLDYRRSGDGPSSGMLQYSKNGAAFTDIMAITYPGSSAEGVSLTQVPINLSGIMALQNVPQTDTVTFRIVNFGATAASGDWYIYDKAISVEHDFEIRGTVCSNPPAFSVTGGGATCSSGTGVNVGLAGSTAGVTYALYLDDAATGITRAGTGAAISFGLQTQAGTYTVKATRNSGGCVQDMTGQVAVTVTPTPGAPTTLTAVTNGNQTELTWNAPDGFTVTGYHVKRSTTLDGTYVILLGGTNVAATNFLVASGVAGVTYYYKVTALNAGCESAPSDAASADWPGDCPLGEAPTLSNPGNKTANVGATLSHSITAQEASPLCSAPTITFSALPGWMTHSINTSGNSATLQLGGVPTEGSQGAFPVTVTAEDTENLTASRTFIIFVGNFNEGGSGGSTPPNSLINWHVTITNLDHASGSDFDLVWKTSPDVAYDVYTASTFPGGSWAPLANNQVTSGTSNEYTVVHGGERTYVQVVPAGTTPGTNGVWGILSPSIPAGISMYTPPLPHSDRAFNGAMGALLGSTLANNTDVYFMSPGDAGDNFWTTLRWNGAAWVHVSGPNDFTLDPGQGLFISTSASATPRFSGAVGNRQTNQNNLVVGFNIIGLSEGKNLSARTAFESANPVADPNFDENMSDQIVILNPNGSWRRLIRQNTTPPRWYDTETKGETTLILEPGKAYYYIRRNSPTTVSF